MAMTKAERDLMAQLRRELDLHRVYVGHALDQAAMLRAAKAKKKGGKS